MDTPQYSNLIPFSIAVVAVNKDPNKDTITAIPVAIMPFLDGEVVDQINKYTVDIKDADGLIKKVEVNTTNAIEAKWLCRDPNVMTAPDVRRGAQVQLYRKSNTDQYYWETTTNTENHQRLEEKIYAFANSSKEEMNVKDPNNYYTQGVSTYRKHVNLIKTTKSDGERWAYDINVDAKNGLVNIMDDIGNFIKLDSKNNCIRIQNGNGTFLELNKDDINWGCKGSRNGKAGKTITEQAAQSINTTSPVHNHVGNYNIAGGISSAPGTNGAGSGIEMVGDMRVRGTGTFSEDVVVSGIRMRTHHHMETSSGGGYTREPING